MWRFTKDLCVTIILASSLYLLGLFAQGCAPATLAPAGAQSPVVTGASVVTLVRPAARWTWGNLSSEEGLTSSGFKLRYEPSCSAFAIPGGLLMTAAHCVEGIEPGGEVRYLSPDGIGHGIAKLLSVNKAHDLATCEAQGLTPLPVTSPPRDGEQVLAVSSFYGQTSYGKVLAALASDRYETSFSIIKGWSGSPVLDTHGRVWGVVSQCNLGPDKLECAPGATIVTALK